jgi:hypothetical protein
MTTTEVTRDGFWVPEGTSECFYYTLKIDDAGFETLRWLSARGYDCGLEDVLEQRPECKSDEYAVPEHKAWEVKEQSDEEAGFACLNWDSAIGEEIRRFLDSVV